MNEFTQMLLDGIRRYGSENIVIIVNKKESFVFIERTNIKRDIISKEYTLSPLEVIQIANTLDVSWKEAKYK